MDIQQALDSVAPSTNILQKWSSSPLPSLGFSMEYSKFLPACLSSYSPLLPGDICISVVDEMVSVYRLYIHQYSALKDSTNKLSNNKVI